MDAISIDTITQFVLAAGAVGTAAMGIVEGAKSVRIKPMGFRHLMRSLDWASPAFQTAYGGECNDMLKSLYRLNRSSGELPRILRQGVRIGLNEDNAAAMAQDVLGQADGALTSVAKDISAGNELTDQQRNVLGRFEVAVDARIDAALALAERSYGNGIRTWSFVVAIALSLAAVKFLGIADYGTGIVVGLISVPLAPIAKDVAKGFQAAAGALGSKAK